MNMEVTFDIHTEYHFLPKRFHLQAIYLRGNLNFALVIDVFPNFVKVSSLKYSFKFKVFLKQINQLVYINAFYSW